MKFSNFLIMGFLSFKFFSNRAAAQEGFTKIDKATFVEAIAADPSAQVVDVRTPGEFARGHFSEAVNIDFFSPDFSTQLDALDPARPVYLYCRSGNRSAKAARLLVDKGFEKIFDLRGGY